MDPVNFHKWLELMRLIIIRRTLTFQVSSDAQTTLDITVSAELNFRAIILHMLTGSYIHPRDLGLRLNIPVIVTTTATGKFAGFKGITRFH